MFKNYDKEFIKFLKRNVSKNVDFKKMFEEICAKTDFEFKPPKKKNKKPLYISLSVISLFIVVGIILIIIF